MATIKSLKDKAQAVANATKVGENTSQRVGSMFVEAAEMMEEMKNVVDENANTVNEATSRVEEAVKKINAVPEVVQETGSSTTAVMSQDAVTKALGNIESTLYAASDDDEEINYVVEKGVYYNANCQSVTYARGSVMRTDISVKGGEKLKISYVCKNKSWPIAFWYKDDNLLSVYTDAEVNVFKTVTVEVPQDANKAVIMSQSTDYSAYPYLSVTKGDGHLGLADISKFVEENSPFDPKKRTTEGYIIANNGNLRESAGNVTIATSYISVKGGYKFAYSGSAISGAVNWLFFADGAVAGYQEAGDFKNKEVVIPDGVDSVLFASNDADKFDVNMTYPAVGLATTTGDSDKVGMTQKAVTKEVRRIDARIALAANSAVSVAESLVTDIEYSNSGYYNDKNEFTSYNYSNSCRTNRISVNSGEQLQLRFTCIGWQGDRTYNTITYVIGYWYSGDEIVGVINAEQSQCRKRTAIYLTVPEGADGAVFTSTATNEEQPYIDVRRTAGAFAIDSSTFEAIDALTRGSYTVSEAKGVMKDTGIVSARQTANYCKYTSPIKCKQGWRFNFFGSGMAVFLHDGELVSAKGDITDSAVIEIPEGVNEVVFASFGASSDYDFPLQVTLAYPTAASQQATSAVNVLTGKKWYCCGDSFSATAGGDVFDSTSAFQGKLKVYSRIIAERNNMDLSLLAVSGHKISGTDSRSFSVSQLPKVGADAEYITLWFGINDSGQTIGTIDDESWDTFYGACNKACLELLTLAPKAKIGFVISDYTGDDYTNAMMAVCRKWAIPYFDFRGQMTGVPANVGGTDSRGEVDPRAIELRNKVFTVSAGGKDKHPNGAAQEYWSTIIENWMRSL